MEAIKQADGTWEVEGLAPWRKTFEHMCKMLRERTQFKFARYGDGEIFCMDGKQGSNCDKHEYFPDLGASLKIALRRSNYMVGLQPLSIYEQRNLSYFEKKPLHNADILHNASIDGRLDEFIEAIKHRFVVLVGPKHLSKLPFYHMHIEIPSLNCWTEYDNTCNEIGVITNQELIKQESIVILLCASMMSEVIIDRFRDATCTFIDCGSVFDPIVGVNSRRYHHNLKVNAVQ